jgi:hypothetical protein
MQDCGSFLDRMIEELQPEDDNAIRPMIQPSAQAYFPFDPRPALVTMILKAKGTLRAIVGIFLAVDMKALGSGYHALVDSRGRTTLANRASSDRRRTITRISSRKFANGHIFRK